MTAAMPKMQRLLRVGGVSPTSVDGLIGEPMPADALAAVDPAPASRSRLVRDLAIRGADAIRALVTRD